MDDETVASRTEGHDTLIEAIVDHLPAMVAYWDAELRNVFANSAYTEVFGMTPDQIRGRRANEVFGDKDTALTSAYTDAALAGHPQHFVRTIVDRRGESRCVSARYIPDVVDGAVVGIYALGTDISELMDAKRAEQDSAEQIAAMAERARIAEVVHTEVLQLLFAATLELSGIPGPRSETALVQINQAIEELRTLLIVPAA